MTEHNLSQEVANKIMEKFKLGVNNEMNFPSPATDAEKAYALDQLI